MTKENLLVRVTAILLNAIDLYEDGEGKLFTKRYGEAIAIFELLEEFYGYEHDNEVVNPIFAKAGRLYDNIKQEY